MPDAQITLTVPEIIALLRDEFRYWSESDSDQERTQLIAMGGAGALSNVLAVIGSGRPAPWHTSHPQHPQGDFGTAISHPAAVTRSAPSKPEPTTP